MIQDISCTGWGLEQQCGLYHFPSGDAVEGQARGSSMNKTLEGAHTTCNRDQLQLWGTAQFPADGSSGEDWH